MQEGRFIEIWLSPKLGIKPTRPAIAAANFTGDLSDQSFIPITQRDAIQIHTEKHDRR
jgi:hypothetical protein